MRSRTSWTVLIGVTAVFIASADSSLAGPPLLCHPIDIGGAESLPFGDDSWSDANSGMDAGRLVEQTLKLLTPTTPLLVRMETLRRATIYAARLDNMGQELVIRLMARLIDDDLTAFELALARFDVGFLFCSFAQMNEVNGHSSFWPFSNKQRLPEMEPYYGYKLLRQSAAELEVDPSYEFACALVTEYPLHAAHRKHVRAALGGAQAGTLLATNILLHFGEHGASLDDIRARYGMADREDGC